MEDKILSLRHYLENWDNSAGYLLVQYRTGGVAGKAEVRNTLIEMLDQSEEIIERMRDIVDDLGRELGEEDARW